MVEIKLTVREAKLVARALAKVEARYAKKGQASETRKYGALKNKVAERVAITETLAAQAIAVDAALATLQ